MFLTFKNQNLWKNPDSRIWQLKCSDLTFATTFKKHGVFNRDFIISMCCSTFQECIVVKEIKMGLKTLRSGKLQKGWQILPETAILFG